MARPDAGTADREGGTGHTEAAYPLRPQRHLYTCTVQSIAPEWMGARPPPYPAVIWPRPRRESDRPSTGLHTPDA